MNTIVRKSNLSCAMIGLFWLYFTLLAQAGQTNAPNTNPETDCGFEGNNDAYGLGIRLAMYTQWITSALIYCFLKQDAPSTIGINNCFQLSIFIGLLYITISQGPDLQASEAYLMFMIGFAGVFMSAPTISLRLLHPFPRKDAGVVGDGKDGEEYTYALATLVRAILKFAIHGYGVWFFFTGMDRMQHSPCSRFGFIYSKVDLYHWSRTVWKVITVGIVSHISLAIAFQVLVEITIQHHFSGYSMRLRPRVGTQNPLPRSEAGSSPPPITGASLCLPIYKLSNAKSFVCCASRFVSILALIPTT